MCVGDMGVFYIEIHSFHIHMQQEEKKTERERDPQNKLDVILGFFFAHFFLFVGKFYIVQVTGTVIGVFFFAGVCI